MFGGVKNLCEPSGCGTVFRLERNSDKTWSETVLKALKKERGMGAIGTVAFDSQGNLYAAAECGGASACGLNPDIDAWFVGTLVRTRHAQLR
jgi:hypothetical protein